MPSRHPLPRASWLLLAVAAALPQCRAAPPPVTRVVGTKLFEEVFAKVRSSSVDTVDDQELYRRAAEGMIEELDDPYALLLLPGQPPPPAEDLAIAPGLYLDRRDGVVVIVATVLGSAADSAGIRPGDRLVEVDSTTVDAARIDQVPALLAGKPGRGLSLRIRRVGVRVPVAITLAPGKLRATGAVDAALLGSGVARLRVTRFVRGIADSVRTWVEALRGEGARSLILDLRQTVGGDLSQGVAVADLFLDAGKTIAESRGRAATASASFSDSSASPFAAMPLAVLIDAGTAGAAEVIAGALQDHDRAAVLGSNSFGRGVTQSTYPLGQGASLRLTTALWMTPSGRQIQRPPRGTAADSLPRPKVKSDAGRTLVGGGGIVPDREVAEGDHVDLALAEARRVLMRASTPAGVFAQVKPGN